MTVRFPAARLGPLVAGLAGLAWFWFELAPQRAGFEDTDNPATGLQFIAAFPGAWVAAGLALAVAALGLVATVIAVRDRLEAADAHRGSGVAVRTASVLGLFAALMLLGQASTRLAGGPVAYVAGLDQGWGETAYLVTQFVGIQLFGAGGLALLGGWILAVAWLGARRGVVPMPLAVLALLPGLRALSIPGVLDFLPQGLWLVFMAAIPASFAWLVALGAWPASRTLLGQPAGAATSGARL